MTENIKCVDCKKYIKIQEKIGIEFIPILNEEEKKAELNNLLEKKNCENIQSCICANCLYDYIRLMKAKTKEEEKKHDNTMISLKNLILDISNRENIEEIMQSVLNNEEITKLKDEYKKKKYERIELEKKINDNKKKLKELKDEEESICIKLNQKIRKREEDNQNNEIMKKKLNYLKKQYANLIKEDDKDDFQ